MTRFVLAIAALASIAGTASAATVVSWDSTGMAGTEASMPVSFMAPHITAASLTRGPGLLGNAGGNSLNTSNWHNNEAGDYVELSVTIEAGWTLALDDFTTSTRSSGTGPGFMAFRSSVDGFSSNLFVVNQAPGGNFVNGVYDVSVLTNLTGTVTFRFMLNNTTAANGGAIGSGGTWRVGDYTADGSNFIDTNFSGTITPAPASFALAGIAGLIAGRRRR
ncbi:MAG: hypothetical protein IT435_03740 [Phycisphaerales bacterium]|nr:hypothetical protein [Phycisphaerales bacterium]